MSTIDTKITYEDKIPLMTSMNTPSGTVTHVAGSIYYSNIQGYEVFHPYVDGQYSPYVYFVTDGDLRYTFDSPISDGEYIVTCDTFADLSGSTISSYMYRQLYGFQVVAHYTDNTTETVYSWTGTETVHKTFIENITLSKTTDYIDFIFNVNDYSGSYVYWYGFNVTNISLREKITTVTTDSGYNIVYSNELKYYKINTTPFVNPTLSSNGTMGESSFAVTANAYYTGHEPYKAFDGQSGDGHGWHISYHNALHTPFEYEMYNPEPLRVNSISIRNYYTSIGEAGKTGSVYAKSNANDNYVKIKDFSNSDDTPNSTWTITFNSSEIGVTDFYKYFKIVFDTVWDTSNGYDIIFVDEITINADEYVSTTEGTSSDYDFTKMVTIYKSIGSSQGQNGIDLNN